MLHTPRYIQLENQALAEAAEATDWAVEGPEVLLGTIERALSLEMVDLAIVLSRRGAALFPDDEQIGRLASVLAPAIVHPSAPPAATGLDASRRWLEAEAHHYRGQWVAVREGRLLAAGRTLREVEAVIGEQADSADTIVMKVLP